MQQLRAEGRLASDERTAWLVHDLVANRPLAQINANTPLQCASLVKPFVIQAYLLTHFVKDAALYPMSERVQNEMRGMVVSSNNEFTNHLFKRLGGPEGVQWMLKKQAPQIFRNIQIVENIPAQGRTYRNRASVADYDRFLRAMWANQLPGAQFLKQIMSIPNPDRIRSKTQFVPQTATVYDKTGSTAMLCGNFGVIECKANGRSYPYTISAVIEKGTAAGNYSSWITSRSNVIREISDIVYLHFAANHRIGNERKSGACPAFLFPNRCRQSIDRSKRTHYVSRNSCKPLVQHAEKSPLSRCPARCRCLCRGRPGRLANPPRQPHDPLYPGQYR